MNKECSENNFSEVEEILKYEEGCETGATVLKYHRVWGPTRSQYTGQAVDVHPVNAEC